MTDTAIENFKFTVFALFIALCFAIGFYAGESVAALSGGGVLYAEAAEINDKASRSYVHVQTVVNGKVTDKTVVGGDGSVSVHVNNGEVQVNGIPASFGGEKMSESAETINTFVIVEANASGESGKAGADGEAGASGSLYASTTWEVSPQKPAPEEIPHGIYQFLREIFSYASSLFSY